MFQASANPFQKMQEERIEKPSAFFDEIKRHVRLRNKKAYVCTNRGRIRAAYMNNNVPAKILVDATNL